MASDYPALDLYHASMALGITTGRDNSPQTPILELPSEMQLDIIDLFDSPALFNLCLVYRHFYSVIKPTTDDLFAAEQTPWATQNSLFACKWCNRLRPRFKFSYLMTHERKNAFGSNRRIRCCIECSISQNIYSLGSYIDIQKYHHDPDNYHPRGVRCKKCLKYSLVAAYCGECSEYDCFELDPSRSSCAATGVCQGYWTSQKASRP